MRLACLIFILAVCANCATTERSQVNTIELDGKYSISFADTVLNPDGQRCGGLYQNCGGVHRITLARDCDIEKYLIHEWLHSKGWHHRTKAETKIFYKELATYGPFKLKRKR